MKSEFYGTDIFLDNEATAEYLDICRNAVKRGDPGEYYEAHRVAPFGVWVHAMPEEPYPKDKIQELMLLPEEHFRCHQLLPSMLEKRTPAYSNAQYDLQRRGANTPEEWATKTRGLNSKKDWRALPEGKKYDGVY